MNEMVTIKEIASATGKDPTVLAKQFNKLGLPFERGPAVGRGQPPKLYAPASLPNTYQDALREWEKRKVLEAVTASAENGSANAVPESLNLSSEAAEAWRRLPEKEREIALARLDVLRVADRYLSTRGSRDKRNRVSKLKTFYLDFSAALADKESDETLRRLGFAAGKSQLVRSHIKNVSHKTDYRWRADYERAEAEQGLGLLGLVRTQREAPGFGAKTLSPERVAYVRAILVKGQIKLEPLSRTHGDGPLLAVSNAAALYRRLEDHFGPREESGLPGYEHFTKWLKGYLITEAESLAAVVLPSFWRSNFSPSAGCASADVWYCGQRWEVDGTPADIMLKDGRFEILVAVDVYSRDVVIVIEKHASSITTVKLMFDGMVRWGKPERIVSDRGSIFISEHVRSACDLIDIDLAPRLAYEPDGKGHVESFNRTVSRMLFESMTWYIGHDPKQRKRIEEYDKFDQVFLHRREDKSEKVSCESTAEEFRATVHHWLEKVYRPGEHQFADLHLGRSKRILERLSSSPRRAPKVSDPKALEMLLSPGIERVFDSGITWLGASYRPVDIPSWEAAQPYARRQVIFRPLLSDVGRATLWELTPEGKVGKLICALACADRGGMSLEDYMKARRTIERDHKQRRKAIETLAGPQTYEAELEAMPMPKVAVGNFGAVEFDGRHYLEAVALNKGEVHRPAGTPPGPLSDEIKSRIFEELKEKESVVEAAKAEAEERIEEARREAREEEDLRTSLLERREPDLWERIEELPDAERYEQVLECEAKGLLIPREVQQWQRYFEATDAFERLSDYFDRRRAVFVSTYKGGKQ